MALKKTMSFAVVHFGVAFGVATVLTGSPLIGGLIALVEPAINTVAYYLHEQLWRLAGTQAAGTA
jgi:uncharacterized membrane protein